MDLRKTRAMLYTKINRALVINHQAICIATETRWMDYGKLLCDALWEDIGCIHEVNCTKNVNSTWVISPVYSPSHILSLKSQCFLRYLIPYVGYLSPFIFLLLLIMSVRCGQVPYPTKLRVLGYK